MFVLCWYWFLSTKRYCFEKPELHRHRIKILGIHENEHNINEDMLVQKIVKQNDLENDLSEIKILYRSKVSTKKFNIVIEVNSYAYRRLIRQEKIYVGWSTCRIIEDFGIIRCFKCNGYGHMRNKCNNEEVCPLCAGSHNMSDCKCDKNKCINCCAANDKYKLKLNVEHTVFSKDCPTLRRITEMLINKYEK